MKKGIAALLLSASCSAAPVIAQTPTCLNADQFTQFEAELPSTVYLLTEMDTVQFPGVKVRLYHDRANNQWVVISYANGNYCLVDFGENLRLLPEEPTF